MLKEAERGEYAPNWYILSRFRGELYGIAILGIIIFHYFEDVSNGKLGGIPGEMAFFYNSVFGSIGVEIFLFLSGMGLCFSMKRDPRLGNFYRKRLKRLLLPYAVCGLFFWGIRDFIILKTGFKGFLMDFTLLSFWLEGVKTLWYIALLLLLYVVYPLLYFFFSRKRPLNFLSFIFLLAVSILFCFWMEAAHPQVMGNTEIAMYRIPIFLCGAYMGERIYAHEKINILDFLFLLAGLVCRLWNVLAAYKVLDTPCPIQDRLADGMFGITLTVMLALLVQACCSPRVGALLRKVGAYSLELFLVHVSIRRLMNLTEYPTMELFNFLFCIAFTLPGVWLLKRAADLFQARGFHGKNQEKKKQYCLYEEKRVK